MMLFRVLLFAALFVTAAFIVNRIYNLNADKMARETDTPSLPVVSIYRDGKVMNRMKGYKTKLDTRLERNCIVPLGDNRNVEVMVEGDYEGAVKYELRDISGSNLIENGEMEYVGNASTDNTDGFVKVLGINSGENGGNDKVYTTSIRMDMRDNEEYSFVILLKDGTEYVRYYTRVVVLERDFLSQLFDYAVEYNHQIFPSSSFNAGEEETEKDKDKKTENDNLWKDINPLLVTSITPDIREITSNTALIELKYIVKSPDNDAVIEYGVTDSVYVSYDISNNVVKLQKSTHRVDEIFASGNITPSTNEERKHYTDRSRSIWSADGRKCIFSNAGELWYYDSRKGEGSRLYGCGSRNSEEDYSFFNRSVPKLISIDNDGNAYFAIIGRMDYGRFEGKNGIFLYEYSALKSEIVLKFFLETDESFDALRTGAERFVWYDSSKDDLYTILDNHLMTYDVKTGKAEALSGEMPQDMIFVDEDGTKVAFPDTDSAQGAEEITLINLVTGKEYQYSKAGSRLRIIGFKDGVLVYGIAAPENIYTGGDGQSVFIYSNIVIVDENGEVSKDYSKSGILIKDVELTSNDLKVTRVVKKEGRYEAYSDDHLTYKVSDKDEDDAMPEALYYRSGIEEVLVKEKRLQFTSASCNPETVSERFYIFWDEGLKECFASLGKAMVYAENNGGIVVSGDGRVIYGISESQPYNTIAGTFDYMNCDSVKNSLGACTLMSMRAAGVDTSGFDINKASEDGYVKTIAEHTDKIEGLNISGADVDTAIGFLSDGIPFTIKMSDDRYVLVISYNSTHVRYYDPIQGKEIRTTKKSFVEDVEEAGLEIYVYQNK
ncbi:MAG: hypothetical protein K6C35_10915 [Eubacterium sp.]|nr:hypothetical protein [Eubacterium sp.]